MIICPSIKVSVVGSGTGKVCLYGRVKLCRPNAVYIYIYKKERERIKTTLFKHNYLLFY